MMTRVRQVETYLTPKDAEHFTRMQRTALMRYVRRGLLTQYRTTGGHRRYALSELRALRTARDAQRSTR